MLEDNARVQKLKDENAKESADGGNLVDCAHSEIEKKVAIVTIIEMDLLGQDDQLELQMLESKHLLLNIHLA